MFLRIAADLLLVFAVSTLPAWVVMLSASFFFFVFPRYGELIVAGFVIDALFGAPSSFLFGFQYIYTALAVILYIGMSAVLHLSRFDRVRM